MDSQIIFDILTEILQYSIDTGELAIQWKLANVVPFFKAGEKTNPSNYRPVSLTCIACKMLEHIILRELNKHLYGNISSDQHGFREGLSSTT